MSTDNAIPMDEADKPLIELSDREKLIAQEVAWFVVKQMTDNFYKEVGRSFISRFFIVAGVGIVGYLVAKGYVKVP